MNYLSIADGLKNICKNLSLGVITSEVIVQKHTEELWRLINEEIENVQQTLSLDTLSESFEIQHLRQAYKSLGKSPSRYRGSAEALIRRILQGKGLYKVNNIVDINNYLSIWTQKSVGSYDIDKITFPAEFRIGNNGECYKGIGKEIINISELPVFSDTTGPYGSPTSDSERAMIRLSTKNIMTVIISFSGTNNLDNELQKAAELLSVHANASNITTSIVV
ncbi:B3/B4 domain-containing protein [Gimesia fumaroli]|uniref:B3/4 domain protein n=1 Tax=Gimesia fumaroli TaxID=2527976 RepID=A0A518I5W2_9PLAN|nr:phenylalanine--tRNA ligase beta subunit-related protein [Gimesia fumaroli]QDV48487.1 B3/4 domain protein [Gimesia fumaroli]